MSSTFKRWLGYGVGSAIGRALFGDGRARDQRTAQPVRTGTEADFRKDEKRFDEDQKRLERQAEDAPKS